MSKTKKNVGLRFACTTFCLSALVSVAGAMPAPASAASTTAATLTGVGAGATALGAGAGAGQGGGPSTSSAAGGSGAPIEVEIMSYSALGEIAKDIAKATKNKLPDATAVLVEDAGSASQIALYQSFLAYFDNLASLHKDLKAKLAIEVWPQQLAFDVAAGATTQAVTIYNHGEDPLTISSIDVEGTDQGVFRLSNPSGCGTIAGNGNCSYRIDFNTHAAPAGHANSFQASVHVKVQGFRSEQTVKLSGTAPPPQPPAPPADGSSSGGRERPDLDLAIMDRLSRANVDLAAASNAAATAAATTTTTAGSSTGSSTSSSSTSPLSLTYLSGISSALGAVKSGMTYTSSSFQPTSQAFEVLVETALFNNGIKAYTSTSVLDLQTAADDLTHKIGRLLAINSDVSNWQTQCKPPATTTQSQQGTQPATPAYNPECATTVVANNLAVAQQLLASYATLLQTSNDSNGNPTIVDLLRGMVLAEKLKGGMPSLQVNVAAAGGSTRGNAFFLLSIFYLPRPSYNAGVVATYELRDKDNELKDSGARTVMYDYNKNYEGGAFKQPAVVKDAPKPDSTDPCAAEVVCAEPDPATGGN